MKTMTCKQLYGPCETLIHGETAGGLLTHIHNNSLLFLKNPYVILQPQNIVSCRDLESVCFPRPFGSFGTNPDSSLHLFHILHYQALPTIQAINTHEAAILYREINLAIPKDLAIGRD